MVEGGSGGGGEHDTLDKKKTCRNGNGSGGGGEREWLHWQRMGGIAVEWVGVEVEENMTLQINKGHAAESKSYSKGERECTGRGREKLQWKGRE